VRLERGEHGDRLLAPTDALRDGLDGSPRAGEGLRDDTLRGQELREPFRVLQEVLRVSELVGQHLRESLGFGETREAGE
jgi:hypothetical protein